MVRLLLSSMPIAVANNTRPKCPTPSSPVITMRCLGKQRVVSAWKDVLSVGMSGVKNHNDRPQCKVYKHALHHLVLLGRLTDTLIQQINFHSKFITGLTCHLSLPRQALQRFGGSRASVGIYRGLLLLPLVASFE